MRGDIISAYVLHSREYRDSSRIAELYSLEHGRLSAVFKGSRSIGKRRNHILEPFRRLSVNLFGRGSLKTGVLSDTQQVFVLPPGVATYSGFYVNELLVRLLSEADANVELFAAYEWVMARLQEAVAVADGLRAFEALLLKYCGAGVDYYFDVDANVIQANIDYSYQVGSGFVAQLQPLDGVLCYNGAIINDIASGRWHGASRRAAKSIQQAALHPLLGDKPLISRQLLKTRS